MQCAGHLGRPVPLLARRLPVPLQRAPYRLPVLRGRFHNHFLDLLLDQPLGQQVQWIGGGAELAPLKLVLAFPATSATTTANIFLCTSIAAIR